MNTKKGIGCIIFIAEIALVIGGIFASSVFASTADGAIDPIYKYAWGENIGWINFGTINGNVHVTSSGLSGYALSENAGWINLSGVINDGSGNLSGYAWGENVGWINFDPANGGVIINSSTGAFTGSALSENAGWIIFGGEYGVKTDWRIVGHARHPEWEPPLALILASSETPTPTLSPSVSPSPIPPISSPSLLGLSEGDTIRATSGDLDIYIVNQFGYKRLFVNPAIFNLYGHLGWAKVKAVATTTRDAFVTSGLFRNCESNSQKVYGLEVNSEDVATLHWVNVTGAQAVAEDPNFFSKVFCINNAEQNLYQTGSDYSSLGEVPVYEK